MKNMINCVSGKIYIVKKRYQNVFFSISSLRITLVSWYFTVFCSPIQCEHMLKWCGHDWMFSWSGWSLKRWLAVIVLPTLTLCVLLLVHHFFLCRLWRVIFARCELLFIFVQILYQRLVRRNMWRKQTASHGSLLYVESPTRPAVQTWGGPRDVLENLKHLSWSFLLNVTPQERL